MTSNAREKLDGNLKASIEFCNKVVIFDLPGSTMKWPEKQPNCTGLRREWERILEAVSRHYSLKK